MTNTLTRRALVGAAPAAVVAASLPAIAAGADEALFALGRDFALAGTMAAAAERRLDEVSAAYDRVAPDRPGVYARQDDELGLDSRPEMRRGKPTGRFYYGAQEIETAELALFVARKPDFPMPDSPEARRKMVRLQEIVDLDARSREARRVAWNATGMEEAERAAEAAHDRLRELRAEIARCPAATMAGVMLKARIAAACFGDTLDEIEAEIGGEIDETTTCAERLALSILRDLACIADRNTTGGLDA